jgi:hypothetical protein
MRFINKQGIRAVLLAGAALLALGACSSSGNTDSAADGANQPPAASSEAQGTGNTDGAPDKAMAMTEPGSDPNATCNLFQISEVTPLVGELEQEGYPNPMNDRYIGGRINSCAWHGEKSSLELIIVGDGQASVVYRQTSMPQTRLNRCAVAIWEAFTATRSACLVTSCTSPMW